MAVTEILLIFAAIISLAYLWLKKYYSYWKQYNVVSIEPHMLFGNFKDMVCMRTSPGEHLSDLYNDKRAENQHFIGIHAFHQPALLVRSPELIKQLLIKDFNKFSNRYTMSDAKNDTLGSHNLFFIKNPGWRQLRVKLSPVFSSGKIKQMFSLLDDVGKKLNAHLSSLPVNPKTNSFVKELKEMCALYTTDVIASVAFGLEANSINNPDGDFRRNGRNLFKFTTWRAIEFTTVFFIPKLVSLLNVKIFTGESTHFLRSTVEYVMSEREKSGIYRNDLIDVLIALKRSESDAETSEEETTFKFTNDILVAQAAIFFTAGYETSSAVMSFGLYELSKRPDLQTRLRSEIKDTLAKNNGEITYESIQNMAYLDMVLQEVLRMYPPLPLLDRECVLAEDEKSYSLGPFGDFAMPNGMPIFVPVYALHMDAKYFPDPETFDPERFASENKDQIIPFTYMPFGVGPHNCIGERFGILQAKLGLVSFLRNHFVRPCEKSVQKMQLDRKALILQASGGIYCDIVRDPLIVN